MQGCFDSFGIYLPDQPSKEKREKNITPESTLLYYASSFNFLSNKAILLFHLFFLTFLDMIDKGNGDNIFCS